MKPPSGTLEYSFKNTARDQVHTVVLNDFNMTIRMGKEELIVPYANITQVQLCKISSDIFRMNVSFSNRLLVITNQYVADNGNVEDRSRVYATFVRVLHFHLKDKSKALYKSGCNHKKLAYRSMAVATASFILCFASDLLGFSVSNAYVDALVLAIISIAILFVFQLSNLPKDYSATNIPLELLPVN